MSRLYWIFFQFLSDNGFDSQSALSNDDALCYLKEFHFDLILLDVHMKGIGFSDFLSYLKDPLGDYSLIPVIAVTGVPDLISKKDKSNLSGILEKPFTPETMMSCIHSIYS